MRGAASRKPANLLAESSHRRGGPLLLRAPPKRRSMTPTQICGTLPGTSLDGHSERAEPDGPLRRRGVPLQREAYPDLRPLIQDVPPPHAFDHPLAIVRETGWDRSDN